jgi:hypothetical protein
MYESLQQVEYPFHDRDIIVAASGRICMAGKKSTSRLCWPVRGSD